MFILQLCSTQNITHDSILVDHNTGCILFARCQKKWDVVLQIWTRGDGLICGSERHSLNEYLVGIVRSDVDPIETKAGPVSGL